jgi:hypothetical protein
MSKTTTDGQISINKCRYVDREKHEQTTSDGQISIKECRKKKDREKHEQSTYRQRSKHLKETAVNSINKYRYPEICINMYR